MYTCMRTHLEKHAVRWMERADDGGQASWSGNARAEHGRVTNLENDPDSRVPVDPDTPPETRRTPGQLLNFSLLNRLQKFSVLKT
jgi:hypothetical protein